MVHLTSEKHYLEAELDQLVQTDEAVWRFIRESCLDGVWYWDLENPDQEWMSPDFWRLFGYDPAARRHDPAEWQDLIHPDDRDLAVANLEKHLADPSYPYDQAVRYKHADGHTIWVRCRGLALRDPSGKPIRLLGAHVDITALKTAQSVARTDADTTLQLVLKTATNGIIGLGADRQVLMANPAARQMLGPLSDDGPFAWPNDTTVLNQDEERPVTTTNDPITRALNGQPLTGEVVRVSCAGTAQPHRRLRIFATPVDDPDVDTRTVLVIEDAP